MGHVGRPPLARPLDRDHLLAGEAHEIGIARINEDVDQPVEEILQLPEEQVMEAVEFVNAVFTPEAGNVSGVVVDLTRSHMGDDSIATAAPAAYHRARSRGADMRFVVMPGRAGGYYRMGGLELAIPTYHRLGGAIDF